MAVWKKIFPSLIILFALSVTQAFADVSGRVVAVTDGDTIKVLDSNDVQHKLRLTGIDAPERAQIHVNAYRNYLALRMFEAEVVTRSGVRQ